MFLISFHITISFSPNNINQIKNVDKVILLSKKYKRIRFYHSLKVQGAHKYSFEIKSKEET
jgi:hypothetical protein